MSPWQVLRAGKVTQAALDYRVHHGPGGLVHYSTAPAAVAPDSSSRSFCLSREKVTMQELNRRLASYLQQVQYLEAANQKLESQIQKELDKKCPGELRQLDRHLRTVSLLQDQMSDCLSAQAQVKLQLLSAELAVFDLNLRCEKERERRGRLEAELSDLRLLEEELCVQRLPELQGLLMEQTQELTELQLEHQQNMQGLLAHMTGGVTVEMQPAASSDLIQQLDVLRQTSVTLLDKNQNENECWLNAQVSMLNSPEVTFDPPAGSEVIQAELEEVRNRAASLEEELTYLRAENMVLEASGREQNESFVQQLVVLQQRADGLCNDLDSVLQATAQQAAEYQSLLDVKTRLETEIQDYMRLLDGLSPQGVSSLHPNSAANITSLCVPTSPCTFRGNITVNKTADLQGGHFRMMEVQDVSRGHIHTVCKTPVVAPVSETVTTVQSVRVQQSKHAMRSPVTSINTSNVTGSFHKSEKERTIAPPDMAGKGSMTFSATINRQGSLVEDKLHTEDHDLKKSSIVSTQISQGLDKGVVAKASKLETNTAKETTMLVSAAVETKPETFTPKQTTTGAGLQANKTERNIQTLITKTVPCVEQDVRQRPTFGTHTTTTDPSKCIVTDGKKETEISVQLNCTEGSIQGKLQDPPQVKSLNLDTQAETVRDVAITASVASGSLILTSEEAQGEVSDDLTLIVDKGIERQEENRKGEEDSTLTLLRLDKSSALSDASKSKQNKVKEGADTVSGIASASSSSPDSNDNLESKTEQGIITLVPATQPAKSAEVQAKPVTFTSNQTTTETGVQASKIETNVQTVITKTIPCVEPEVKQGSNFVAHTTTTDLSRQTAAEVKRETETVTSAQINCTDGSVQAKNKDLAQVVSSSLETQAETIQGTGNVSIMASVVSGSNIVMSEEAQEKVSGGLTLMNNKNIEGQDKNGQDKGVEGTLTVLRSDHSIELADASTSKQNKVTEDADTGSSIVTATSSSPDSNDNLESKTEQGIITLVPATQSARSAEVQAKPATFTSNQTTTETGVQASKIETNVQTVVTKTIPCVEPEVKQGSNFVAHTITTDLSRQTAAEVKRETETVTSAQMNNTEGSIKGIKDPAQIVSSSLETQAETIQGAGNVSIMASVVSGSNIVTSEEAQEKVSCGMNLMNNKDIEGQEKNGQDKGVEGTLTVLRSDHSIELPDASTSKQNKVTEDADTGSSIVTATSSSPDSNDNLESKTEQGIITLVPATQSARSADVQAKPATFTSNQTTTETGVQASKIETNVQTVVTKTIPCVEPEVKQGSNFVAHTITNDPNKQTAAEVNKKTETVISALMNHTEDSIQGKHQDPAQVVSLCPETPAEAVEDAGEVAVKALVQVKVSGDLTLMDDKDKERQEKKGEEEIADPTSSLSDVSDSKQNKVVEDADTGLGTATVSSDSPDSNDNLESKNASTESLRKVELVKKGEVFNNLHNTKDVKGDPAELDNEMVILADQEAETEMLMSVTDQVFCPVKERVLSPSDSGTCLIPVEAKVCPSPNGDEEDEEVCQSLTEAISRVRPVEKYILSTKEEGQSPSFSRDQALPEVDRNRKISVSLRGGESLCVGSLEGDKGSRGTVNGTGNSKPTSQGISPQMNSSGMARDMAANNNSNTDAAGIQGGFRRDSGVRKVYGGGVGQTSVSLTNTGSKESPSGATIPATSQQETGRLSNRGSGEWMVYGGSLGHKSSLPRTKSEESPSAAMLLATSPPKTSFGSRGSGVVYSSSSKHTSILAGNDSLPKTESRESLPSAMHRALSPPGTGKFGSRGSGEWKVYSGSTGRISSWAGSDNLATADRKENPSVATQLPVSPPGSIGARKFGSRGSGEWRVYGGSTGRISSWAGSDNLATADRKENPPVAAQLPISPPGSTGGGKFGSRGSGEWRVYSGSTGRISSWAGNDNLATADRKENPPVAAQLPISPPGSTGGRKFGSRGSGEWRVYGRSTGRISSWTGSDNLPTADRELPISPPGSTGAGRFGSGGSGEWRVYGGSTGRLSTASNTDRVSSRLGHSSGSSSGRLGSGSVVRRSSSLGSVGRLSSSGSGGKLSSPSGSNRTSTSGRFSNAAGSECKPVYSSASGRKSTVGSAGRSGGGGTIGSQRAPSPGGRMSASMGSLGRLSSPITGGTSNGSSGSGSKLSSAGGSDRVSSRTGGRISSSSGSGRTNSTGGRVISSSDRPIRSTGSGAGSNKERISVCKMAALSMSAAGRERSEDRQKQAQRHQQQQKQAGGTSPLLQRWLSSGSEDKTANPDGLDDIMPL